MARFKLATNEYFKRKFTRGSIKSIYIFNYAGAEQAAGVRLSAHKKLCAKRVI